MPVIEHRASITGNVDVITIDRGLAWEEGVPRSPWFHADAL